MLAGLSLAAVDSEKMSKSLGNFFTIRTVVERYHPLALRLFLVSTQYRQSINFTQRALEEVRNQPSTLSICPTVRFTLLDLREAQAASCSSPCPSGPLYSEPLHLQSTFLCIVPDTSKARLTACGSTQTQAGQRLAEVWVLGWGANAKMHTCCAVHLAPQVLQS